MWTKNEVIDRLQEWCDRQDANCPLVCLDALHMLKEQKKGTWECYTSFNKNIWMCSECGRKINWEGYINPIQTGRFNFCPVCGADMREVKE